MNYALLFHACEYLPFYANIVFPNIVKIACDVFRGLEVIVMFKIFTRVVLFFVLVSTAPAYAKVKYYQYTGDMPFLEMMLNMMTTMGILEKVPVNYMHDIAYSRQNNYYPGMSGIRPGLGFPYNRLNQYGAWQRPGVIGPGVINPGAIHPSSECRSILCGNRSEVLNGLWVAKNGEMLGVKNQKFLWNDGAEKYFTGRLRVKNGLMMADLDGLNTRLRYTYTIRNNKLIMRDKKGVITIYKRVRPSDRTPGRY